MARNRNRQPGPILRNVVQPRPAATVGTDPALRAPVRVTITGPGPRRTRAASLAMPSGDGQGTSDWSRPMIVGGNMGRTIRDHRWTQTVSNQNI